MKKITKIFLAMALCTCGLMANGCGSSDKFVGTWGSEGRDVWASSQPIYNQLEVKKNGDDYLVTANSYIYQISTKSTAPQVILQWVPSKMNGTNVQVGLNKVSDTMLQGNQFKITYLEKDKALLVTGAFGNSQTFKPESKDLVANIKNKAQAYWKERLLNNKFQKDWNSPSYVVKELKFEEATTAK